MTDSGKSFVWAVLCAMFCLAAVSCARNTGYVAFSGYAQGGTYSVKINMDGVGTDADVLKAGVDSLLDAVDNSLSGYNKGSLLSCFNRGERIRPDSLLLEIYRQSKEYYDMTAGAVDVSAGALFDIWGFGFTTDSLPSDEVVAAVKKYIGMGRLAPDMSSAIGPDGCLSASDIVTDGHPEHQPELNFNAVAQGFTCDVIASYLKGKGVEDMLVDVGGEIFCKGVNPQGKPWTIGVDKPVDGNDVSGADLKGILQAGPQECGVVTSGNYRKFYVRDGRKYAHTIDPSTGYPVTHSLLSATVVAPDAAEADALATYCMVVGLDKASEYISSRDDVEGYLIYQDSDGSMKTWKSAGFRLISE